MGKNWKLITIIIVALALRLVNLNQSFWLDEASQAQLSQMPAAQIWNARDADFQPPLFYFLAHFWIQFGKSEIWLRLLPVSFGVLSVVIIYFLAQQLKPNLGLYSAFLLAINPFHIYYSQEFRMYSLLMLLAMVSLILLLRKSKYLFLANAALLYTHYASVFFIAFELVYLIILKKNNKWFVLQNLLSAVLYLPWLPHLLAQLKAGTNIDNYLPGWRSVLGLPAIKAIPEILFKFTAGRINLFPKYVYAVYIVFVLAVVIFSFILAKSQRKLLWSWLAIPVLFSLALSPLIPQTQTFRIIYILPALIIIFAQASLKYPRLMLTLLIYISVFGNVLYFTRPRLQREQWRQALDFVTSKPGEVAVKFGSAFAPMTWYTPNLPVQGLVKKYPADTTDVATNIATLTNKDVYVFDYLSGLTDPQNIVDEEMKYQGYKLEITYNFEGVGLISHYHQP